MAGIRILVVDDEPDIVEIVGFYFSQRGFEVFEASNGNEALALIQSQPIDIVVSDVRMPECDGIQLLEKIQKLKSPRPGLVFMSGFADIDEVKAVEMGAAGLCGKPIEFKELLARVNQILEKKKSQK